MPKLVDVLTNEEKIEIDRLKVALLESKTRKDIRYYRNQIDAILDRAEQRYFSTKEIKSAKEEQSATLLASY
ncbi:hypothetical protein [Alkalihalobacillus sp. BA299]|uniref:hypothetical protein n=1 Tax=Alkalihalobacillus sp. BA299 TaxID=2815938 RepID=UPI001ADD1699|nr:hypothetical protein [Alkalihalobacillus sp. BA299]